MEGLLLVLDKYSIQYCPCASDFRFITFQCSSVHATYKSSQSTTTTQQHTQLAIGQILSISHTHCNTHSESTQGCLSHLTWRTQSLNHMFSTLPFSHPFIYRHSLSPTPLSFISPPFPSFLFPSSTTLSVGNSFSGEGVSFPVGEKLP